MLISFTHLRYVFFHCLCIDFSKDERKFTEMKGEMFMQSQVLVPLD